MIGGVGPGRCAQVAVAMQHVPQEEREGFALIYDKARLGNWTTSRTVPVGTHTHLIGNI